MVTVRKPFAPSGDRPAMDDIEFAAFLVSRVCHDLVGPLGAVVNGLEVMEDERDAAMRADALKIVTSSALQALARLQFMRIAFGAAGSAGAELDVGEIGRLVTGLLEGGKVQLDWRGRSCELAQELGETPDERSPPGRGLPAARRSAHRDGRRRSGRAGLQNRGDQPLCPRAGTMSRTRCGVRKLISTPAASSPFSPTSCRAI